MRRTSRTAMTALGWCLLHACTQLSQVQPGPAISGLERRTLRPNFKSVATIVL